MAQRDRCCGDCKAQRSEHARQGSGQGSAQPPLGNYTGTDVLGTTYLGCFGLRVSVLSTVFSKPLPGIVTSAETV